MTETMTAPGVALLFADADLSAHLREALVTLGARIVFEGAASDVQPEALANCGADVIVVNLEPTDDEHLDSLYFALSDSAHRVVFNDAEASRDLSGWDKARWARHLAVKLVGSGDVDPPRPTDARRVETVSVETKADDDTPDEAERQETASAPAPMAADDLSAELEAILSEQKQADETSSVEASESDSDTNAPDVDVEQRQTIATPAPTVDWELEDADSAPEPPAERDDASQFGIEKMQPADYLKPEDGDTSVPIKTETKLELVSLEESVAPGMADRTVSEMRLDTEASPVNRLVLVGAGADATLEVGEFLAGLPEAFPALVLIVQHQHDQQAGALADALDTSTPLPVKVVSDGDMARRSEAWLIPAGHHCRLGRDGRMKLQAGEVNGQGDPSIDECLDRLVDEFGKNMTVIILSGGGSDGLAGTRKIAQHGGQVWVLDAASSDNDVTLAASIQAEGLATFQGSPSDLARRLVEDNA